MEATKTLNLKELNELVVTLVTKLEEQQIQIKRRELAESKRDSWQRSTAAPCPCGG